MAEVLGTAFPTLVDFKNKYDRGDNLIADIAEIMYEENPIFQDIPWRSGNDLTGHTYYYRTELPTAQSRAVNQGIKNSMSKTSSDHVATEEFATRFQMDQHAVNELFSTSGEANAYLTGEERPHVYALTQKVLTAMMYGTNPAGVQGFMTRLNSLDGAYGDRILDAAETITPDGQNPKFRSILMVRWDGNEITGIYNKYGTMGINVKRYEALVDDPEGDQYWAYGMDMHWHCGLMVRDKRYIGRIANIDISKLNTAANRTKLFELMLKLKNEIHRADSGKTVFYMSPELYYPIELAAIEKGNLALSYEHIQNNVAVTRFAGYPIVKNDIMKFDEDKVE